MRGCLLAVLLIACSSEPAAFSGSGGSGGKAPTSDAGSSSGAALPSGGQAASGGTEQGGSDPNPGEGGEAGDVTTGGTDTGGGGAAAGSDAGGSGGSAGAAVSSGGGGQSGAGGLASGGGGNPTCVMQVFFRDADGDSYGLGSKSIQACDKPSGYVSDVTDCYDDNALAHPGQTMWFAEDRGDGSFDYDCSGNEELRYPAFTTCPDPPLSNDCPPPQYWPSGFSCDYLGMFGTWPEQEGWRRYRTSACLPDPCPGEMQSVIPACGASGRFGRPTAKWANTTHQWTCDENPPLSAEITQLELRQQTCH